MESATIFAICFFLILMGSVIYHFSDNNDNETGKYIGIGAIATGVIIIAVLVLKVFMLI